MSAVSVLFVFLSLLAAFLAVALAYLYLKIRKIHAFWFDRGVPHLEPKLLGNLAEIPVIGIYDAIKNLYDANKNRKFVGMWSFHRPAMLVNDPDLVKKILVQDFSHFQDHGAYYNERDDPLSANLFALEGMKWRNLRVKLTPTFTSGKMKYMFPTLIDISHTFKQICDKIAATDGLFDAKEMIARFSTDIIASCAFGLQTNCLENPNAEFRQMGRKIFEPTWRVFLRNTIAFLVPDLAKKLNLIVTPKDVTNFFIRILHDTIDYRVEKNESRSDFLQLLINLMQKGSVENVDYDDSTNRMSQKFTFNEAAAQAFVFYIGGFETSSSVLQFTLFALAKHQDIQEKLRQEIMDQLEKDDGKLTYEGVHGMKYMGAVLDETLRLYSPAPILTRECTAPYKIPDTNYIIDKGVLVYIPVSGFHNDERYYANPTQFDPERFTEAAKASRKNFVYLPFGEGPRLCIGQRFAQMQMRVALAVLLSNYRFECCDKTPKEIKFDPKSFIVLPIGGMTLKIVKL